MSNAEQTLEEPSLVDNLETLSKAMEDVDWTEVPNISVPDAAMFAKRVNTATEDLRTSTARDK